MRQLTGGLAGGLAGRLLQQVLLAGAVVGSWATLAALR